MRKIREMLRLTWVAQRSHREVARSLGVSAGAVASAIGRARVLELSWAAVEALSDDTLEPRLYGPRAADVGVNEVRRVRQLEDENARLKRLVADLTLDTHMLAEALREEA